MATIIQTADCDHQSLDTGPCRCLKKDRCAECCGKCNRVYIVWYKHDQRYRAEIQAESATKARQAGLASMHNAGYKNVSYIDMQAKLRNP